MTESTKKYDILFSKSFNLYKEDGVATLNFKIESGKITFEFEFLEDPEKGNQIEYKGSIDSSDPSANTATVSVKAFNFQSPLGIATSEPIKVLTDTNTNKNIYFSSFGQVISNSCLNVTVTVFRDK